MTAGITVVIPTHARPREIARCLAALAASNHPKDRLEVVVVEDGGPAEELAALRAQPPGGLEVVWLAQPQAGPAAARNHGARHATHAFLAFTDDDCRPRPDWIGAIAARLHAAPDGVVGGHTHNALTANPWSGASQSLVTYITAYGQRRATPFFASNNVALARESFVRVGGFDESFALAGGEDRDLCDRCVELGLLLTHAPEAVIDHEHHLSLRTFWRQHFRYGRGAYWFHRARAARKGTSLFADMTSSIWSVDLRFYVDLVRHPFVRAEPRRITTSLLLLLSQLPNALGFFAEMARAPWTARAQAAPFDRT